MIEKFQYFSGYLRIKVWGFSPERFINLCGNREILLWDIEQSKDGYQMNISLKNFYKLRPIARKTGVKVVILKRYGLPFFAPVVRQRKMFAAGVILAASFWIASSFFLLDVEFEGNLRITDELLNNFMKEEQVSAGMLKSRVDIDRLEKDLRKTFPEIIWTSVKISGGRLIVSVKENDAPILDSALGGEETAGNLVSEVDGTVVSILVRAGVPKVSAGDTVKAGDLLVEGIIPVYNDDQTVKSYTYVNADADILIEHVESISETLPDYYTEKVYTGREETSYSLRLFGKELKISKESPYLIYDNVIRTSRPDLFEKLSLPVFWGENTYREYLNVEYRYSASQVKDIFSEQLKRILESFIEKGVQIIEKNVKIDHNEYGWVMSGEIIVREPAAKSVSLSY